MMLKSSIILVLLAVAASCHFDDKFQTIGSYERSDKTSKTWYLSTGNSTWSDAVKECKSHGMKLTTFGSDKEEADELLNIYSSSSNNPDAFIGYTDQFQEEGTFTTFDGEKLQVDLDFHKNEPNNGGGVEHCLEFYTLNDVLKFNDVDCNIEQQFICELESLIIIGSYERSDKTSKTWYLSTGSSKWSDAVAVCKSHGMNLATFGSNKEEADKLLNIYRSSSNNPDAFIGYTDEFQEEGTFTTFDGEKLQVDLDFHKNEPNNGGGVEHCLEFYTLNDVLKFNDVDCNIEQQFICELESLIIIGSYEKPDKTSKTWYLSTGSSKWSDAVAVCKSHGMNLATFGSNKEEADEFLRIYSSSSDNPDAFIGYTDEEHEGTFTTFEGDKLQVDLDFHKNEPNNYRGLENCLEFYTLNDVVKFNDVDCNIKQQFICESESKYQSCDRANKDNIRLQNDLDEAELSLQNKDKLLNEAELKLQRKDELFNAEKSKHEEILKGLQNALNEGELNLQHKDGLLIEAELNLERKDELFNAEKSKHEEILKLMQNDLSESNLQLQNKESLLEVEKSSHKETIKQCNDEIFSLKRTILQQINRF